MKTLLLVLLCIFYALGMKASNKSLNTSDDSVNVSNYSVSNPYKVIDAYLRHYISNGKEIISLKFIDKTIYFQKFDGETMNLLQSNKLEKMPPVLNIEALRKINNKYYLFYSATDKKRDKEQLYVREISFELCNFSSEPVLLLEANGEISKLSISAMPGILGIFYGIQNMFKFQTSADQKRILVHYRLNPEKKDDSKSFDKIGLHVMDENLKVIWGKEMNMPYTEGKMDNLDYTVDGAGNAYVLASVYSETTKEKSQIELLKYQANSEKPSITKINFNKTEIVKDLAVFEGPDKNMFIAGYISHYLSKSVDGVVSIKIDSNGNITNQSQSEIPIEIINQNERKKTIEKNSKDEEEDAAEMYGLEATELYFENDGSSLMIGEQYWSNTYYSTMAKKNITRSCYFSILVTKFDSEGKVLWMQKIPKRQYGGENKGTLSFYHTATENNHYFIFFDHLKNHQLSNEDLPAKYGDGGGGYLLAEQVNKVTGDRKRLTLLSTYDVKGYVIYQFSTGRIQNIGGKNIIMEAYKKDKEDILIKIPLEE